MRTGWIVALAMLAMGCSQERAAARIAPVPQMQAFADDKALAAFLARRMPQRSRSFDGAVPAPPPVVAMPAAPAPSADGAAEIVVTSSRAAEPGITNTQEADVDEGGIVKTHGDHLVVLRRGRLFTVAVGDHAMRPVDRIDAFPPGASGAGAWYDEMLVAGDRVVVIGFSYDRGGTEINRFRISADGRLRFEDSHHLRSNDYYSSTNYASRLIGNRLVLYTPLDLDPARPIAGQLPALRRWTGTGGAFRRVAPATRIYLPEPVRRDPDASVDTLHSVTTCDLAAATLACAGGGVLGTGGGTFYVSGTAVYVWIADALGGRRALVYRLPLDGGRPGAVQAWGGPVDQFSFREDRARGTLDMLVRADAAGTAMWRAEVSEGDAALLRLPIASFGNGSRIATRAAYRPLPLDRGPNWSFHNRFVGRWLLYSAGEFAQEARRRTLFAVPLDGSGAVARIAVPHAVDRIDIMGSDAVAIGNDAGGRLGFSAVELGAAPPRIGDTSFLPAAREGERRSQAFFYRPDPDSPDGASGTLGLPVTRDLADARAARFLGAGSAVAFLRRDARRFTPAGELAAQPERARDDGCEASCVDWYGNARPIFLRGRIFALMGYELVEGRLESGRVREVARIDFAPRPAASIGRNEK